MASLNGPTKKKCQAFLQIRHWGGGLQSNKINPLYQKIVDIWTSTLVVFKKHSKCTKLSFYVHWVYDTIFTRKRSLRCFISSKEDKNLCFKNSLEYPRKYGFIYLYSEFRIILKFVSCDVETVQIVYDTMHILDEMKYLKEIVYDAALCFGFSKLNN